MRKLLVTIVVLLACFISISIYRSPSSAQEIDQVKGSINRKNTTRGGVEQSGIRTSSVLSIQDIIAMSDSQVVPTISEDNKTYAIGFTSNSFFKVKIWEGANKSFGISRGHLMVAMPKDGDTGDGLFIINLRTNESRQSLTDYSILNAEWQPQRQSFAAIASRGNAVDLLFCDLERGIYQHLRQKASFPGFIKWSEDSNTFFFVERVASETQVDGERLHLVRHVLETSGESGIIIDEEVLRALPLATDSQLQSPDLSNTEILYSSPEAYASFSLNVDRTNNIRLQSGRNEVQIITDAIALRRLSGGLLLRSSNSRDGHLWLWNHQSGEKYRLDQRNGGATIQDDQLAETGLVGAWYLSFPLSMQTSTSATINSIFDHQMTGPYADDNVTVAYTGEKGEQRYGSRHVWGTHYGFKNANNTDFIVNGNYAGGGNATSGDFRYLYYDGHPGFDYRAGETTQLYASADGTIVEVSDTTNTFYIDHGNGYRSY